MRRTLPLLFGATFLVFAVAACEGPEGPAGPAGQQGEQGPSGPQGPQGPPGDLTVACSDCHSSDATIVGIENQFALSPHGFPQYEVRGPDYAGGACIACHSHGGFVAAATGTEPDWSGGVVTMNCRTCHQVHEQYEAGDYALTTTDPVTLRISGETVDVGGDDTPGSNLCANCHQGRTRDGWPNWEAPVTQMFEITSSHFGVHGSPQTNIYTTRLDPLFEFNVTTNRLFSPHVDVSCLGCHMGIRVEGFTPPPTTADGELSHTYEPATEVCATCHDADFNYGGVQEEVAEMLEDLGACLVAEGVMEIAEHEGAILADHGAFDAPEYHPVVGSHPEPYVAAYLVYNAIVEDGSYGVHNPRYGPDLVEAALEYMESNSDNCPVAP